MNPALTTISTQDLIDELGRRAHALVIGGAFLTHQAGNVDTKFNRKGAFFDTEGLAAKLHRICQSDADRAVPNNPPIPGVGSPFNVVIQPLGNPPAGRQS